ncbi:hypothetical protein IMZ48_32785, partial [Candidatus Bathyarchaeota archaeon]|nr:hypothetical protein [Candidatus Bathyarchaeota archaeon]
MKAGEPRFPLYKSHIQAKDRRKKTRPCSPATIHRALTSDTTYSASPSGPRDVEDAKLVDDHSKLASRHKQLTSDHEGLLWGYNQQRDKLMGEKDVIIKGHLKAISELEIVRDDLQHQLELERKKN